MVAVTDPPKPKLRGALHQIAFFTFVPLLVWLVGSGGSGGQRIALGLYSLCLLAMLGVSALYHRGRWSAPARQRLKRLDHSTILLAIAGTYTPVVGIGLPPGRARTLILAVVWSGAVAGIAIRMLWLHAPRSLVAAVYVIVGWTAVPALATLARELRTVAFGLVLGGGLLYSVGAVTYTTKRPDPNPAVFGYHEVFHSFVVLAALAHFAAIAVVALRA